MDGLRRSARIAARLAELQQQGEAGDVEQLVAPPLAFPGPQPAAGQNIGGNPRPQEIIVDAGEDVVKKIKSFSRRENRGITILSATGRVSKVLILVPGYRGQIITFWDDYKLLSLNGHCEPRGGRTSYVTIAMVDVIGRNWGGKLGGGLIASSQVKVFVDTWPLQ